MITKEEIKRIKESCEERMKKKHLVHIYKKRSEWNKKGNTYCGLFGELQNRKDRNLKEVPGAIQATTVIMSSNCPKCIDKAIHLESAKVNMYMDHLLVVQGCVDDDQF